MLIRGSKINLVPISSVLSSSFSYEEEGVDRRNEDTNLILKWRNSDSVRSNFIFQEPLTQVMHETWLKEKVTTGKVVQFIIVERENDRKIGSAYLRDIDVDNNNAEFGIFIGEDDARGKGYGTEATRLLTEYGFSVLGLHRIFLRVLERNKQAIQSYLNAGYEIEGIAKDMVKSTVNTVYTQTQPQPWGGGGVSKHRIHVSYSSAEGTRRS